MRIGRDGSGSLLGFRGSLGFCFFCRGTSPRGNASLSTFAGGDLLWGCWRTHEPCVPTLEENWRRVGGGRFLWEGGEVEGGEVGDGPGGEGCGGESEGVGVGAVGVFDGGDLPYVTFHSSSAVDADFAAGGESLGVFFPEFHADVGGEAADVHLKSFHFAVAYRAVGTAGIGIATITPCFVANLAEEPADFVAPHPEEEELGEVGFFTMFFAATAVVDGDGVCGIVVFYPGAERGYVFVDGFADGIGIYSVAQAHYVPSGCLVADRIGYATQYPQGFIVAQFCGSDSAEIGVFSGNFGKYGSYLGRVDVGFEGGCYPES